jgi:replicative DNA helicase
MTDSTIHTQHQDSARRLIKWIAEHGVHPGLTAADLTRLMPAIMRASLEIVLVSPGQGFRTFLSRLEHEGMTEAEDFESLSSEKTRKKDIDTLLVDIRTLSEKARRIEVLERAITELESGDALREMDALVGVRDSVTGGLLDDTPQETVVIPGDLDVLKQVCEDRKSNPRTFTVFDSWTILGAGELGVILGAPNVGKTTALVELGTGYMSHNDGLMVHFSEEMKASSVTAKYAACLSNMKLNGRMQNAAIRKFNREVSKAKGSLVIESHATGTSTVQYLEHRARELLRKSEAKRITAVIVDYAGLLRTLSSGQMSRFDSLSKIVVALRGMAINLGCPVWTGSQPQRNPTRDMQQALHLANMDLPVLGMADVGECWAIPQVADYLISLNQTQKERESKPPIVRVHRAKVREPIENAVDDFTITQRVDYATCIFA